MIIKVWQTHLRRGVEVDRQPVLNGVQAPHQSLEGAVHVFDASQLALQSGEQHFEQVEDVRVPAGKEENGV